MHENEFEEHTVDLKCPPIKKNEEKCPLCEVPVPKPSKSLLSFFSGKDKKTH
jgi:hypothetical protein